VLIAILILALPRVSAPMLNNIASVRWLRAVRNDPRGQPSEQDLRTLEKWVRLARQANPSFAPALYREGQILCAHGQIDQAVNLWQQAVDIEPQNVIWLNTLGDALAQQGRWLDAGQVWYQAGRHHYELINDPDYRRWLAFAIVDSQVNPSHEEDYQYRAFALNLINIQTVDQHGYVMAAAVKELDELGQIPERPWLLNVLAASIRWEEPEQAISVAQRGLALTPADSSLLVMLGDLYVHVRQPGQALLALLEARKAGIPDTDGRWLHLMGATMLQQGDLASASDYLLRAEQQAPGSVHIQMSLGELYERLGDMPRALEHYRRALALAPEAQYARQAVERLAGK
jgi:tetratricopeptide (TPR) repeat protein